MAFIPYADPQLAANTLKPQATSLAPYSNSYTNNLSNLGNIVGTNPTYTNAAANQVSRLQTANDAGTGSVGGAATGGSTSSAGGASGPSLDQINSVYDVNSNYYNSLYNNIDPQRQAAQGFVDQNYNNQLTGLGHQRDTAFQNLDMQGNRLNDSYARGLRSLGDSVRNTLQAQNNALGTAGAGDSSATGMLAYALANMQNQNRGDMLHNLNDQTTQLALNRNQYQTQFDDQKNSLDMWKQQKYSDVGNQFNTLRDQINQQLVGNEQARRQALANAGQWAQGQVAAVDQTIANHLQNAASAWQNSAAPQVSLGNIPAYQAQNIVPQQLQVQGALTSPVSAQSIQQAYNPFAQRKEDQYGY